MAGPISGLIVQPIVGVISDRSKSRFGRRKPFILFGSIFIVLGLLLISNAQSLGTELFGDSEKDKSVSIFLAILGFWILDLSNNAVQGPCRALLVDVAAPSQQGLGSSLFSIMLGIGNLLGYLMGSIHLVEIVPFMKTDIRALFTVKEDNFIGLEEKSVQNPITTIYKGIVEMPKFLGRVCWVQFFSWIGWFSFILFVTTWMGINVYGGNPNAPEGSKLRILFQEGVRKGSLGLTFSAAVTIGISLLIPIFIRIIGIKNVYFLGNLFQAIFFALFYFINTPVGSIVLITATGISWAVVMIIPFTLVGMGISGEQSGLFIGTLNIFIVIPQLLVSIGISFVISFFNGDVVYSLVTGAISSIIATILVLRIIVPSREVEDIEDFTIIQHNESDEDDHGNTSLISGDQLLEKSISSNTRSPSITGVSLARKKSIHSVHVV
eukprot:gene5667-7053_t